MRVISYLRRRLDERSTWAGMVAAVTGAAALSMPWSAIVAAIGTIAVLIPEPKA